MQFELHTPTCLPCHLDGKLFSSLGTCNPLTTTTIMRTVLMILLTILLNISTSARAAGDLVRGEQLYTARCGACHAIDDNSAGPRHRNVVGRLAATQEGYEYSNALKKSQLRWTLRNLDRWLANPNRLVPGNKMAVQLANDAKDRQDIIAYLEAQSTATQPGAGHRHK